MLKIDDGYGMTGGESTQVLCTLRMQNSYERYDDVYMDAAYCIDAPSFIPAGSTASSYNKYDGEYYELSMCTFRDAS